MLMNENNIPAGYKDSAVGIIPQEWEVKRLGEICDIYVGKDVRKNHFKEIADGKYKYPVYSNTVENQGLYGYYDYEEYENNTVTVVGRGVGLGTAFARDNGYGAIGRLIVLKPFGNMDNHFLANCINTQIHFYVESAAIPQLTGEQIATYKVVQPSIEEQQKIVGILKIWDEAIAKQNKLIKALEKRKKALIQRLLTGSVRLPGFTGEWSQMPLKELFSERTETNCIDLPLLSITADKGVILQSESDKRDNSNEDKSKYKRICPNDIGYNTMRMWQGRSALSQIEGIVSPAYTIVVPNANVYPLFIAELLKRPRVVYDFWAHSQGLVSDTLNCKFPDFAQVKVCIPPLEEQMAIAKVLVSADNEIKQHNIKLNQLRKQKQGLMQQLLTGKKRVK